VFLYSEDGSKGRAAAVLRYLGRPALDLCQHQYSCVVSRDSSWTAVARALRVRQQQHRGSRRRRQQRSCVHGAANFGPVSAPGWVLGQQQVQSRQGQAQQAAAKVLVVAGVLGHSPPDLPSCCILTRVRLFCMAVIGY
jgi:hypothetical protein